MVSYLPLKTLGRKVGRKRNRFRVVKWLVWDKNGVKCTYKNAFDFDNKSNVDPECRSSNLCQFQWVKYL